MTASNFLACFNETAFFEGGYSDNAHDPGGATMAGVTQATYTAWLQKHGRPNVQVKAIPLTDRQAIYRELFWNAVRGDDLYPGLDLVMTDSAWGSGSFVAIKFLQRALGGITIDGVLGNETMQAVGKSDRTALLNAVCGQRMAFFKGLSTWQYFGKGWTARLEGIQKTALAMNATALKEPAIPTRVDVLVATASPTAPTPTVADRVNAIQETLYRVDPANVKESWLARGEAWLVEHLGMD